LIKAGKSPETPAAIVRRCSWPDQQTISCTLATLADEIERRRLRPPALAVVGSVAALGAEHGWFVDRPLFGTRVLVTRPPGQAAVLVAMLTELGAGVVVQPAIEIAPPDYWAPLDRALASLGHYDWLVFSSANGVQAVLDRLLTVGDLRALAGVKLAAIGPGTADELARYHLRADLVPKHFRAESLAEELASRLSTNSRILLARASRGREVLADGLRAAGHAVEQIVAYTSRDVARPDPDVADLLRDGRIDWITVTSSAINGGAPRAGLRRGGRGSAVHDGRPGRGPGRRPRFAPRGQRVNE
jgi:uroporphyrinogen III methyltransferase/synthase